MQRLIRTATWTAKCLAGVLIVAGITVACGATPTGPDSFDAGLPHVISIAPANPVVSGLPQSITITGTNFAPGMTATLTAPSGQATPYDGGQLQNFSATTFTLNVVLAQTGTYSVVLTDPGNEASAAFAFLVRSASQSSQAPVISSVSPTSVAVSANTQGISIGGANFVAGLSVTISRPDAHTVVAWAGDILGLTSTSFVLNAIFDVPGTYTITVVNPDGQGSNAAVVVAQ